MTWIITGGAGFIGKNLVIELIEQGESVLVVDKKSWEDSGFGELLHVVRGPDAKFRYLHRDLTKSQDLDFSEWFSPRGGDVVVHLAAMSGVKDCSAVPLAAFYINLEATFALLDGAADFKADRFVYASSGAVVAGRGGCPSEVTSPHPVNVYGSMKAAAEQLCRGFFHERGLSTSAMRFSNVYGPYSKHKGSAVHKFVRAALAHETIEVHGDGTQKRDFVFVDDVVDALIMTGKMSRSGANVFHVSSGQPIAVLYDDSGDSLYDMVREAVNEDEVPFVLVSEDPGVPEASLDSSVTRRTLRIGDPTPLVEGLRKTVSWYQGLKD